MTLQELKEEIYYIADEMLLEKDAADRIITEIADDLYEVVKDDSITLDTSGVYSRIKVAVTQAVLPEEIVLRNMDSVYFRIKRNDKFCNICFSDLTDEEMNSMLKDRNREWLDSMMKILLSELASAAQIISAKDIAASSYLDDDNLKESVKIIGKALRRIGDTYDLAK